MNKTKLSGAFDDALSKGTIIKKKQVTLDGILINSPFKTEKKI
jgi:hypothetical protein